MKRIFVLAGVLCLGACASQPTTAVTADQPADQANNATLAVNVQATQSSDRAYLEDHVLIHVQAPPSKRRVLVLGARKDTN